MNPDGTKQRQYLTKRNSKELNLRRSVLLFKYSLLVLPQPNYEEEYRHKHTRKKFPMLRLRSLIKAIQNYLLPRTIFSIPLVFFRLVSPEMTNFPCVHWGKEVVLAENVTT